MRRKTVYLAALIGMGMFLVNISLGIAAKPEFYSSDDPSMGAMIRSGPGRGAYVLKSSKAYVDNIDFKVTISYSEANYTPFFRLRIILKATGIDYFYSLQTGSSPLQFINYTDRCYIYEYWNVTTPVLTESFTGNVISTINDVREQTGNGWIQSTSLQQSHLFVNQSEAYFYVPDYTDDELDKALNWFVLFDIAYDSSVATITVEFLTPSGATIIIIIMTGCGVGVGSIGIKVKYKSKRGGR